MTGVPVSGSTFAAELSSFAHGLGTSQPATVALATSVLLFLFVVRWRWPHAPGPLLAMLLATGAVAAFGLTSHGVSVVGPIPGGLPAPQLPDVHWHELGELLLPAVSVLPRVFRPLGLAVGPFGPGSSDRGPALSAV